MRKLKPNIMNALIYIQSEGKGESITSVASKYKTERHVLSRRLKHKLLEKASYIDGQWWELSDNEKKALEFYNQNKDVPYRVITERYRIKKETFERILNVHSVKKPIRRYIREFNRDAFREITTEADAYWLGFILADGYLNEDRGFLNIKLGAKDIDHLRKFCDYVSIDYSIIKNDVGGSGQRIYSVMLSSRSVINNLTKYGLRQRKSCAEVPYWEIDNHLKKHYVRGIFDGDGWIRAKLNGIGCVGSLETLGFIREYLGGVVELNYGYINKKQKIMNFEIRNSKIIKEIITHLYKDSNIFLERKMNLAKQLF